MKKFAICCLAIAAVALFSPAAQAKTLCYHLTYFCDGVQSTTATVGGNQGVEAVGLWDWVCLANGTGTLTSGTKNKFGTQPLYPYTGGTGSGFNANFTFKPLTMTFDLYGTFDGVSNFAFQLNSPYQVENGACTPLHRTNGLRPATAR